MLVKQKIYEFKDSEKYKWKQKTISEEEKKNNTVEINTYETNSSTIRIDIELLFDYIRFNNGCSDSHRYCKNHCNN